MKTIYIPSWIPVVPQPAQDRLLEKQWRAKSFRRTWRKQGRWPQGALA
jgi:hypothetical protein